MRLHEVVDGRAYASDGRTVFVESDPFTFEPLGRIPRPPNASIVHRFATTRPWKSFIERVVGSYSTTNILRVGDADVLGTLGPWLFASHDGGETWGVVQELPPSSGQMGVLPSAICHHDGSAYVGEYPLDSEATPRILRSDDGGRTWSVALELPEVRHVHAVQTDPHSGGLWVTTGDADRECRIGRLRDGELEVVGGGSQRWRAVELAFTESAVLWGMDCAYAESNDIFALDRAVLDDDAPMPRKVHTVSGSVFYSASLEAGDDRWVAFSTAAEHGSDSTAPDRGGSGGSEIATVVAASSATEFTDWHELARFRRRTPPSDVLNPGGILPRANAYVFLAADPDRGVLINPYNTVTQDGTISAISPEVFASLCEPRLAGTAP